MNIHQFPYAYFITFTTYGSWLHGSPKTSVDRFNNQLGARRKKASLPLEMLMRSQTIYSSIYLNHQERELVLQAIKRGCDRYGWRLVAAHVRTNHVHLLVSAEEKPEKIMVQLKAFASHALNQLHFQKRKYWSRHGSTKYIWSDALLFPLVEYIIDRQGKRMACFYQDWYEEAKKNFD